MEHPMRRLGCVALAAAMAAMLAVALVACGEKNEPAADDEGSTVQIPNPWTTYTTLADAEAAAGFALSVPETVMSKDITLIQAMDGGIIQVSYGSSDARVLVRKGPGSGDISGDYNSYPSTQIITVDDVAVTVKGSEDRFSTAMWAAKGYSYAILFDSPAIIDTIIDLVQHIE